MTRKDGWSAKKLNTKIIGMKKLDLLINIFSRYGVRLDFYLNRINCIKWQFSLSILNSFQNVKFQNVNWERRWTLINKLYQNCISVLTWRGRSTFIGNCHLSDWNFNKSHVNYCCLNGFKCFNSFLFIYCLPSHIVFLIQPVSFTIFPLLCSTCCIVKYNY